MPLNVFRRNGIWHYRGTIGPPERRARVRGSTNLKATKRNKPTAEGYVAAIEDRYWKGYTDGPASILTFAVAVDNYRAVGKDDIYLEPLKNYFGNTLVKDIKPSTIVTAANKLYPNCKNTTKNRAGITPAQAVINENAKAGLCSPIKVERFKDDGETKEPATSEWVQAFRGAATEVMGTYALFMFLTGCRPSEGLAIDPERDLDLKAGTCIIRNTKVRGQHRGKRIAHLPAVLVTALANMPTEPGRPLFWYKSLKVVRWPWDQAVKRAGIERLTPHSCRHGCATQLLRRGVDVVTVGWLIDMTPEMVLKTYGHALKDATLTDRIVDTPDMRAVLELVGKTG